MDLYRAWEARYTSWGRKRRAEGRWRRDRKVGKVWGGWGRRLEGPPYFGFIEITRRLWGKTRVWWEVMEYRRRVSLWWELWRGVVDESRQMRGLRLCDRYWHCASCGYVEYRVEGCVDCGTAQETVVEEEEEEYC